MPSYAILGATGNTGKALLEVLLKSPENQIHAYCRSRAKLLRVCPAAAREQVRIFEGKLDDADLLVDCLRGTHAAFLAVAVIDNMPGCTIAYDTARSVVNALNTIRSETHADGSAKPKLPKLLVLSSASLEDSFCTDVPAIVHLVLGTAVSHLYRDLTQAEKYLRGEESWITSIFVKPGGLVHDRQGGHEISTTTAKTPLSFLDLAAGMMEVANNDAGQYDMKNVSVLAKANDVRFPWDGMYFTMTGIIFHYFPWTYRYIGEYRN